MRCTNFTELNRRLVGFAINELREAVYAAGGEVVFNDRYNPVIAWSGSAAPPTTASNLSR